MSGAIPAQEPADESGEARPGADAGAPARPGDGGVSGEPGGEPGREGSAPGGPTPAPGRPAPRALAAALVALALSLGAFAALFLLLRFPMADVLVYRAEGRAVLHGSELYGFTVTEWDLPATYPPFAALLFVPAATLSPAAVKTAFVLVNVALLVLLVHLSARFAGYRTGAPALLAATAGALWLEPVFQSVIFGQINLLLACLVLWDLGRPDGARGKGLAVGIAAGIKLTPAIFAVHLLLTGRVRAACTALAGFAGTVVAGAFVLPADSVEFWSRRLFETGRVGKAWIIDNQSLQGALARALHLAEPGPLWLVPAALAGAGGLWLARRAHVRHGRESWAVLCTAFTALLISPISWSHHWVWCVPLLAVLLVRARTAPGRRQRAAAWCWAAAVALVFTARSLWLVPKQGSLDLRLDWWHQAMAAPYALLTAGLLAAVAWRLHRLRHRPAPGTSGPAAGGGRAQTSSAAGSSSVASTMR